MKKLSFIFLILGAIAVHAAPPPLYRNAVSTNVAPATPSLSFNVAPTNYMDTAESARPSIVMLGDSIAAGGTSFNIFYGFKNRFIREHYLGGIETAAFKSGGSSFYFSFAGSWSQSTVADVWWENNGVFQLTAGGYATSAGPDCPVRINRLEYYYVASPTNGTTRLYTSPDNSTWTAVLTLDQTTARGLAFTNVALTNGNYYLRVSNVSGASPFVWFGGVNTNSLKPLVINATGPGKNATDFLNMGTNNWQTILTNAAPGLITWMWLKDVSQRTNWPAIRGVLDANYPRADKRIVSSHRISPADETTSENNVARMVAADRYHAYTNFVAGVNFGFLDLFNPWPWSTISSNSYYASGGHYSAEGEAWESERIWEGLNLSAAVARMNSGNGEAFSATRYLTKSITSSTTLQDDDELTINNVPPGLYRLDVELFFSSSDNTPGMQYGISLPTGLTLATAHVLRSNGSGGSGQNMLSWGHKLLGTWNTLAASALDAVNTGVSTEFNCFPYVIFRSNTSGTVKIKWSQFNSSATALTLDPGSSLRLTRL
jgi:hypothetical protein